MWAGPGRPKAGAAGPESEHSYLASAADLMIGLLFIFIIMVAFLALQKKSEQAAAAAKIAELERQKEREMLGLQDPRGRVTLAIGEAVRKTLANVTVDPRSGVISLPEDVLFDRGSSILKAGAPDKLKQVAKTLTSVLPCYVASEALRLKCERVSGNDRIETIFIEGHTDNVPMNTPGGNIQLSLDRSISMNRALVSGTALDRYRNDQQQPIFSYSAYADTRPIKGIDPSNGRNRRVDLRIVLTYRPPDAGRGLKAASTVASGLH